MSAWLQNSSYCMDVLSWETVCMLVVKELHWRPFDYSPPPIWLPGTNIVAICTSFFSKNLVILGVLTAALHKACFLLNTIALPTPKYVGNAERSHGCFYNGLINILTSNTEGTLQLAGTNFEASCWLWQPPQPHNPHVHLCHHHHALIPSLYFQIDSLPTSN